LTLFLKIRSDLPDGLTTLNRLAKCLLHAAIGTDQFAASQSADRGNTGYELGFSSASFGFLALDFAGAFDA
jgi:hypothetical protein